MRTLIFSVCMLMTMTMASAQTKESNMMTIEQLNDEKQIRDLVNEFANLADVKDAKAQGELFLPDGKVEFQIGMDGQLQEIKGREPLVQAFAATINSISSGIIITPLTNDELFVLSYVQSVKSKNL
jgi:hypothetical protein